MIHNLKVIISIFRTSKKPWKVLWAYFLIRTGLNKYFTIGMNGYKLNLSRSSIAIALFIDKEDRQDDEDFLRKVLNAGDTYVDVGANIGTLVLTASNVVSNSGNVIGIEPHPTTFKCLEANVSLNKFNNISLINSAVGNQKGSLFFSSIINSDDTNKVELEENNGIEVRVDTLDEMLKEHKNISLLKIDVEGYEKFVLEGASDTLKKTKIVFFESWEEHFNNYDYDTGNIIKLLHNSNFDVYKIDNDKLHHLDSDYRSLNCENLLALKTAKSFINKYDYKLV